MLTFLFNLTVLLALIGSIGALINLKKPNKKLFFFVGILVLDLIVACIGFYLTLVKYNLI